MARATAGGVTGDAYGNIVEASGLAETAAHVEAGVGAGRGTESAERDPAEERGDERRWP